MKDDEGILNKFLYFFLWGKQQALPVDDNFWTDKEEAVDLSYLPKRLI